MIKPIILVFSWFVSGGLAYYGIQMHGENQRLANDVSSLQVIRQQYQQQVDVNARQRQEFETQVQQLQSSLLGAQAQMSNLSEALQQAREMITPSPTPTPTPTINNANSVPIR